MKIARQLILGAVACCITGAVFFIVSCSSNNNPVASGGQMYAAPTYLRALSGDDTLYVVWTASTAKDSSAFAGYYITALDAVSGSSVTVTDPNKNDTSIAIPSLTNGRVYTLTIKSLATDGTQGPASTSLQWAPAKRYYGIRVYSLAASSGCPSGLALSSADSVQAVSVSQNPNLVDLVFDDHQGVYDIATPQGSSTHTPLPRHTLLAPYNGTASSLSDLSLADTSVVDTGWAEGYTSIGSGGNGMATNGKGIAYYVKTQDGNYARVFVHPNGTQLVTLDTDPNDPCNGATYITVDVSFQTSAGMKYSLAHRAGQNMRKTN